MEINKNTIYRFFWYMIGLVFFAFGISFSIRSKLGGNPMSVLVEGVDVQLPFSFGMCNLLVGVIQLVIGYLCDKRNVTIATLIAMVTGSFIIDFGNYIIPITDDIRVMYLYMMIGVIIYCVGVGIQIQASIGLSNLDLFIFGLMKVTKIDSYKKMRWICDAGFLIVGYLLGGTIGVGTLVLLVVSGYLIEKFGLVFKKILKF